MNDLNVSNLMKAAAERQLAVAALQKKEYEGQESFPTEQLVLDMQELLATERIVLDAIITLFVELGHGRGDSDCP